MPQYFSPPESSSSDRPIKRQRTIKEEDKSAQPYTLSSTPAWVGPPAPVAEKPIRLDPEQERALDLIFRGYNVFLTGGAGSGKSVVLRIAEARLRDIGKRVRLCAPTGMAAHGVGGTTIHSCFGLDPKKMELPIHRLENLVKDGPVKERIAS